MTDQAFPSLERVESWKHRDAGEEPDVYYVQREGMSLRDYFAGQAIGAVIQQCAGDHFGYPAASTIEEHFARNAYAVADAMLKMREGAPPPP